MACRQAPVEQTEPPPRSLVIRLCFQKACLVGVCARRALQRIGCVRHGVKTVRDSSQSRADELCDFRQNGTAVLDFSFFSFFGCRDDVSPLGPDDWTYNQASFRIPLRAEFGHGLRMLSQRFAVEYGVPDMDV